MIYVTYERTSRISKFICTLPLRWLTIQFNSIFISLILNFTFKGLHKPHIAKLIEAG